MRPTKRQRLALHVAAPVIGLLYLLPVAWAMVASVTPSKALLEKPLRWLPRELDFSRYVAILTPGGVNGVGDGFLEAMVNSLIVATVTVTIALVVSIFGAYAFARLKFRGRQPTLLLFLGTYMLPQIALLIPLYFILNQLRLLDTRAGLVIVDLALVVPFTLWILSNYFLTVPEDLEDAARVDGCSRMGALWRIVLPSARPGIITAVMFAFFLAWDEFLYALIFTSSYAAKTIPVAIAEFSGRYTTDFGLVAAGGLIAALPPVLIALVFQRNIASGMSAGAIKG
ncbi:MAG: carbohydrate ABC transporter permease [Propioniciclava sp.]